MPPLLKATDLHPFNRFDVPSLLAMRAVHRRDHPFIVWEPFEGAAQSWTYGQFHHQVGRLAGGLAQRGVVAGDRLLIHLDNCPEMLVAMFGTFWAGSPQLTPQTSIAIMARVRAVVTISATGTDSPAR